MAQAKASSRSRSRSKTGTGSRSNGAKASSKKRRSKPREREYDDFAIVDPKDIGEGPDVLLDVPVVKVDEIDLEVENLRARLSVNAEVRGLVELNVGAEAHLGKVELNIQGVEAQALVKARLDNVSAILQRVVLSLDRNPALLESVGEALERVGGGAGQLLGESGEAVEEVGQGTGRAVQGVGRGTGKGVKEIGQGAGKGAGKLGKGG
jgi:ribosome assembly protein YihI (activator of Der GTPase)